MNLTDLPEDILFIIIPLLDSKSIYNVYNTCKYLRRISCLHGVVKKLDLSMNTLATGHSLKLDFFKEISAHLQELNMRGVPDLKKSSLLPVMKKLKCLKTLDISYTNINMVDLIEIYQRCPSIKNISVNFVFGKLGLTEISNNIMEQCQNIFTNFKNVHFVGSISNLLCSALSQYVVSKSNLDTLKYTVSECNYAFTTNHTLLDFEELEQRVQFKQFKIFVLNWREEKKHYQNASSFPLLSYFNWREYEFIFITMLSINRYYVFISSGFKTFFDENLDDVEAEVIDEFNQPLFGNIAIMMWKKDCNNFDQLFFSKLFNDIKDFFPVFCTLNDGPASTKFNWFYSILSRKPEDIPLLYEPETARSRIAAPNCVLNYDPLFKDKENIMLTIKFREYIRNAVALSDSCAYLRKLTFLSLSGGVRYTTDFFKVLFTCSNLITLNVEAISLSPCALPVSRYIHLNKSLKNVRLVDRVIDFKTLFLSLSKCTTLANIHVVEATESEPCSIADPSVLIQNCDNLFNVYIEAPMNESEQTKNLRLVNKTKDLCKKYHVNVVINVKALNYRHRYYYDPFLDVFNLSSLKQT